MSFDDTMRVLATKKFVDKMRDLPVGTSAELKGFFTRLTQANEEDAIVELGQPSNDKVETLGTSGVFLYFTISTDASNRKIVLFIDLIKEK